MADTDATAAPAVSPVAILATLRGARRLLSHPDYWTKEAMARDAEGNHVLNYSQAKSFCIGGAICATLGAFNVIDEPMPIETATRRYLLGLLPESITAFNDNSTFAEVVALLDTAIRRLEIATTESGEAGGHHGGGAVAA